MKTGSDFRTNLVDISEVASPVEGNPPLPPKKTSFGRLALEKWLHSTMKIEMTDGRTLVGSFMCTDRDNNIILGSCTEHLQPDEDGREEEGRILGLAMIPGRHIVSICIDEVPQQSSTLYT